MDAEQVIEAYKRKAEEGKEPRCVVLLRYVIAYPQFGIELRFARAEEKHTETNNKKKKRG